MEILKDAKPGTHLNSLQSYYIRFRVKENKHTQLHMAVQLQHWIHQQHITFQSNMYVC
jgi:hypothetical protein